MHLADGEVPREYLQYTGRKISAILGGVLLLILLLILSISVGAVWIPPAEVATALVSGLIERVNGLFNLSLPNVFAGQVPQMEDSIIWNIRLPQALAGIVAGLGLSVAGLAMQSILRNPLASPYTLGTSHAAAFGAAFSVMILGAGTMQSTGTSVNISNPLLTTVSAFVFALLATIVILAISKMRQTSPEVMVLAGVALGSLAVAGTMFLQYFADDNQLAAMVFWTFGDLGRASWNELPIIAVPVALAAVYFYLNSWNYNAIDAGDETAKGLGVNVERIRLVGMLLASMVVAIVVAFLGVIGFVGLVCPHMVRRVIGDDHRFLIPGACVAGAVLLLAADTVARIMLAPHILPVAILTAFMGAPVFLYLLVRGYARC
ncbi:iron ABC transporter permease [Methanofollis formosanus]|uniref:Cobalamin import system permease protein BtuC n=1 Tax=Methanofollis formosanus TaxID=299308 RepID=A0A8G1A0F6_9EURY|nr:iron ABC transporter permease [Methanofollis formosanus]QYZ78183.1 iron ABC transporter permease [Methanofollis formosanus]